MTTYSTEAEESSRAPSVATIAAALAEVMGAASQEALGPPEAAIYLGVSVAKVHDLNNRGLMPEPAELGIRCPRWTRTELKAWLLSGSPSRTTWRTIRESAIRKFN